MKVLSCCCNAMKIHDEAASLLLTSFSSQELSYIVKEAVRFKNFSELIRVQLILLEIG